MNIRLTGNSSPVFSLEKLFFPTMLAGIKAEAFCRGRTEAAGLEPQVQAFALHVRELYNRLDDCFRAELQIRYPEMLKENPSTAATAMYFGPTFKVLLPNFDVRNPLRKGAVIGMLERTMQKMLRTAIEKMAVRDLSSLSQTGSGSFIAALVSEVSSVIENEVQLYGWFDGPLRVGDCREIHRHDAASDKTDVAELICDPSKSWGLTLVRLVPTTAAPLYRRINQVLDMLRKSFPNLHDSVGADQYFLGLLADYFISCKLMKSRSDVSGFLDAVEEVKVPQVKAWIRANTIM